jgi:hypothetical protein
MTQMSRRKKRKKTKRRSSPRRIHSKESKRTSSPSSTGYLLKLAEDIRSRSGFDEMSILINPEDQEPLSDRLPEILGDFLMDMATNKEEMERLLFLAVTAWNATVVPEDLQQELFERTIGELPEEIHELVFAMMERKRQLYPDDHRYVVDFQVDDLGDTFHISVASAMILPET